MKTKTGKLLMQLNSHNSSIKTPKTFAQEQIIYNHARHSKPNTGQNLLKKQYSQPINTHVTSHNQFLLVKQQNNKFHQAIESLKQENQKLNKLCEQLADQLKQQKSNTKTKSKIQKSQEQQNKTNPKQLLSSKESLQQKVNALELQNYRLIQQNYLMMINMKKNLKLFKESFLDIANKLQNLEYIESAKQIYRMLNKIKQNQNKTYLMEGQFMPDKKQQKNIKNQIVIKKPKLNTNSSVFTFRFQPQQQKTKIIQQQVKQQQHKSIKQLSEFQLIGTNKYRSQSQFSKTRPLFGSQYHDKQIQSLYLDQASINQQIQSDGDQNQHRNSHGNISKFKSQQVIHKCYGNNNQFYRMMLLQAAAIDELVLIKG